MFNVPGWGSIKPGFGRILTFASGGTAKMEIPPFGHSGPPKPAIHMNAPRETLLEGKLLYRTYCLPCHGVDVVAGSLPDLRCVSAEVHHQFISIVLGGERKSRGMPSLKDVLTEKQARSIEAYVFVQRNPHVQPRTKLLHPPTP